MGREDLDWYLSSKKNKDDEPYIEDDIQTINKIKTDIGVIEELMSKVKKYNLE